jgi:hypothetical protein
MKRRKRMKKYMVWLMLSVFVGVSLCSCSSNGGGVGRQEQPTNKGNGASAKSKVSVGSDTTSHAGNEAKGDPDKGVQRLSKRVKAGDTFVFEMFKLFGEDKMKMYEIKITHTDVDNNSEILVVKGGVAGWEGFDMQSKAVPIGISNDSKNIFMSVAMHNSKCSLKLFYGNTASCVSNINEGWIPVNDLLSKHWKVGGTGSLAVQGD